MLRFTAPFLVATAISVSSLWAQEIKADKTEELFLALGMPDMIEIMRDEGLSSSRTLGDDMLPGGATTRWMTAVDAIYDLEMMQEEVQGAFREALEGDDLDAMIAFFTSELGATVINLEVSARRALLDDAVDAVSKDNAAIAMLDETPRYLMIKDFVEANDLIEANVVGALNSSYAFYLGLIDGGAMPAGMTAESALQDVWTQEPDIRASTTEWIYAFLLMAYQPLSDEELEAYIAFSQTEAGQDLNEALFTSFNGMFDDISRALGLASSRFIVSQEL